MVLVPNKLTQFSTGKKLNTAAAIGADWEMNNHGTENKFMRLHIKYIYSLGFENED
jgi:hypothetical protein